jgi:hypothetical protein
MPLVPWPDVVLARLGLAVVLAWIAAAGFWFALRTPSATRVGLLCLAVLSAAAAPTLIPADSPGARALSMFLCVDAIFRLVDANRRAAEYPATREGLRKYVRFFVPFPVLLVTGEERAASERVTSPIGPAVVRTVIGLGLFLSAWAVLFALQKSALLRSSFVLDHVVKTTLFAFTLEIIGLLANGLERLAGFETPKLMNRILWSRTPAEFWLRYNTRVHMWLIRNVFRRVGAAHHPVWGVVLVFFVSAVFHEAAFDIALSRVDGYQFAFFMLQIPAVLASPALERFAKRGPNASLVARAITMAWLGSTSVFFFRGIGEIFPFYYTAPMPGPVFGEWRF